MKLLAIETSTEACSVGLLIDNQLKTDHRLAPQQHGKLVLPMIDALMSDAGLQPAQLDGVVYGRGPGSFTGVRIGVALTQGIALGADLGVIGISTLQSVAQGVHRVHGDTHVSVSLDARMSEVYHAAFVVGDAGLAMPVTDEVVCPPEAIAELDTAQAWVWCGSGAERYPDTLPAGADGQAVVTRADAWPCAEDLLALAIPLFNAGKMLTAEQAAPVYLRNKVAETTAEREEAKRLRSV